MLSTLTKTIGPFSAFVFLFMIVPAHAQESRFDIDTRLTFQYITEDGLDLGTAANDSEDSLSEQLQLLIGADITEEFSAFFHGRAINVDGQSGFDDDTGRTIGTEQAFLEMRELYVTKSNLLGVPPLSLQVGRQRLREDRALWWNSDQDLVRLNYNSTLLSGFLAAGENLSSYRTGRGDDYLQEDQDRFRTLGQISWQYVYNHVLEGRFLYEKDHSSLESAGTVIDINDRDNEDQNLVWFGARAAGSFAQAPLALGKLKYRADVIGVSGEEDIVDSTAGPGLTQRTVTGSRQRDVSAWAFDGTVNLDPASEGGIIFTAGYAFGSGDGDPTSGTNNAFRQSDMQGSSSRIGLERQQQKNYGEVLRPELSNLHILMVGAGYPLTDASDIGVSYFNYQLDENAVRLRSSGISAALNNTDKSVGQAVDLFVNVDVDDELNLKAPYTEDIDFRIVGGSFFPGDAYSPGASGEAFRLFTEVKFRF